MKKSILLPAATLFVIIMFGACNNPQTQNEKANSTEPAKTDSTVTTQIFNLDTTMLATGETFYQCEMDHDVLSDKPGNCSKCGMELSEMKKL